MKKIKLLVAASAILVSATALAGSHHWKDRYGPQGFNTPNPSTVAAVHRDAYDDQYVTLRGRLINYLGRDHYEFADQTGTIEVELDDDYDWSFISKDEYIEIIGKVDRDFMSTSIDVKRARSLEKVQPQVDSNAPRATTLPVLPHQQPQVQPAPQVQLAPQAQPTPQVQPALQAQPTPQVQPAPQAQPTPAP